MRQALSGDRTTTNEPGPAVPQTEMNQTRMNTDRGQKIRVHSCPSVVKKFAQPEETFGHKSPMNWTRRKEEGCSNSADVHKVEAARGNPRNVSACVSQRFVFIR